MSACTLDGICGGCRYSAMPYDEQLAMKQSQLLALLYEGKREKEKKGATPLKGVMSEDSVWEGIIPSPQEYGYRNKMEYSFGDEEKDGPLTLGMHRMKSFYSVVTFDCCLLVHPDFNVIVKAVREFFDERHIPYMHKKTHEGYLRHLLLRRSAATGELMIVLVTKSDGEIRIGVQPGSTTDTQQSEDSQIAESMNVEVQPGMEGRIFDAGKLLAEFRDMLLALPLEGKIAGILHTKNDALADAVVDEGTEVL